MPSVCVMSAYAAFRKLRDMRTDADSAREQFLTWTGLLAGAPPGAPHAAPAASEPDPRALVGTCL